MAELSTAAWVLHDLGLAAGFGGNLFGKVALNPAVKSIPDARERGKVVHDAWEGYRVVSAISLVAVAGTWLIGRTLVSGRSAGKKVRALTLSKDALVASTVGTGVASMILGGLLDREVERGQFPVQPGSEPSPNASLHARRLQRAVNIVGDANIVLSGAVLGITTILAMQSGKSAKWSFLSRFLP